MSVEVVLGYTDMDHAYSWYEGEIKVFDNIDEAHEFCKKNSSRRQYYSIKSVVNLNGGESL